SPARSHSSAEEQVPALVPVQTPPWHVSLCVHALPSLHAVPLARGVATQLLVSPSEEQVPTLHASFRAVPSLSLVHRTARTHSEGDELGDDDGYEQTSMSSGVPPLGKSAIF